MASLVSFFMEKKSFQKTICSHKFVPYPDKFKESSLSYGIHISQRKKQIQSKPFQWILVILYLSQKNKKPGHPSRKTGYVTVIRPSGWSPVIFPMMAAVISLSFMMFTHSSACFRGNENRRPPEVWGSKIRSEYTWRTEESI